MYDDYEQQRYPEPVSDDDDDDENEYFNHIARLLETMIEMLQEIISHTQYIKNE